MNIAEIDDALSAALHALSAAQATLRKGASTRDLDVLRKLDDQPRASTALVGRDGSGAIAKAATALADLERRVARQEAQRDLDAQYPARKTAVQ
jgi:hypothetical protein